MTQKSDSKSHLNFYIIEELNKILHEEKAINLHLEIYEALKDYLNYSIEDFNIMPDVVNRSKCPCFYWGCGNKKHITLTASKYDGLILSIITPDTEEKCVFNSSQLGVDEAIFKINKTIDLINDF